MARRILLSWVVLVPVLLALAPKVGGHEEDTLDPHNASPGVRLGLRQVPLSTPALAVRYQLHGTGFATGTVFSLWAQEFGRPFRMVASDLRIDSLGNVGSRDMVGGAAQDRIKPLELEPGYSPPGAAWMVALVSVDRTIRAFAAVIPYPIVARDGPCKLQLELVSYRGDRFVATGSGFSPGEEVAIESASGSRTNRKRQRILKDGRLVPDVVSHVQLDSERTARYTVAGNSCRVTIDYRWGEEALEARSSGERPR
jgi:hypothetical protein